MIQTKCYHLQEGFADRHKLNIGYLYDSFDRWPWLLSLPVTLLTTLLHP